jgi:hypothetical protein
MQDLTALNKPTSNTESKGAVDLTEVKYATVHVTELELRYGEACTGGAHVTYSRTKTRVACNTRTDQQINTS